MSDKDQSQQKTKTPWIPMLAIALFCSGISGGAVYYLSHKEISEKVIGTEDKSKAKEPVVVVAPIYLKIAPFTVNIKSDSARPRLLYSGVSFKLGDHETEKFLSEHMVEIRSRMLMLVADSKAEELVTPEGKAILTAKIMDMFKLPFSEPQPELSVTEALFTDFIVQ